MTFMEDYLHHVLDLTADDAVEVMLDNQANVLLLDEVNFAKYRRGEPYHYQGGFTTRSLVNLSAPSAGRWHVVIDLGGRSGSVSPAIRILHPA